MSFHFKKAEESDRIIQTQSWAGMTAVFFGSLYLHTKIRSHEED